MWRFKKFQRVWQTKYVQWNTFFIPTVIQNVIELKQTDVFKNIVNVIDIGMGNFYRVGQESKVDTPWTTVLTLVSNTSLRLVEYHLWDYNIYEPII